MWVTLEPTFEKPLRAVGAQLAHRTIDDMMLPCMYLNLVRAMLIFFSKLPTTSFFGAAPFPHADQMRAYPGLSSRIVSARCSSRSGVAKPRAAEAHTMSRVSVFPCQIGSAARARVDAQRSNEATSRSMSAS